jgi:hypothetical protein
MPKRDRYEAKNIAPDTGGLADYCDGGNGRTRA